jgi:hypothetical protein
MHQHAATAARPTQHHHAVRFYESERALAQIVAGFLGEGLTAGNPAIVVATASQRAAILLELSLRRLDVVELQQSGALILLDADDTMAMFMVDGNPDERKFHDAMCAVIRRACGERTDCTVRIYGHMVDVLWVRGERDAAIRLEMLWNRLAATQSFSLLCGYAMGNFYKDAHVEDVCRQHTHTIEANGQSTPVA